MLGSNFEVQATVQSIVWPFSNVCDANLDLSKCSACKLHLRYLILIINGSASLTGNHTNTLLPIYYIYISIVIELLFHFIIYVDCNLYMYFMCKNFMFVV